MGYMDARMSRRTLLHGALLGGLGLTAAVVVGCGDDSGRNNYDTCSLSLYQVKDGNLTGSSLAYPVRTT